MGGFDKSGFDTMELTSSYVATYLFPISHIKAIIRIQPGQAVSVYLYPGAGEGHFPDWLGYSSSPSSI